MFFRRSKRGGRLPRVVWPVGWAAVVCGLLIASFAKLALILTGGDFWIVLSGAVACLGLAFVADFAVDYFFED